MKRFITWLLIASMIFTSAGFTTLADNVNVSDVVEGVKEATTEVVESFLVSEDETENEVANDEVVSDETTNAELLGEASEEESTIEETAMDSVDEEETYDETDLETEAESVETEAESVETEAESIETEDIAETDLETESVSIENVETETAPIEKLETSETETAATEETTSKTWILDKKLYDVFSEHDKIENNTPYPLIFKKGGSMPDGVVDLGVVGTSTDGDYLYGYFNTLNKDVKKLTIWIPSENDELYLAEDATEIFSNLSINKIQNIEMLNTSKTTNMSHLFENCRDLTSLDLSSFDTSNVVDMSYMFSMGTLGNQLTKSSVLNSLDISSFDTKNVENMESMFQGIINLTKLNLDNFDTSNVTNMSSMFSSLSNVETITFGDNFNTSNVTDMSSMFEYCSKLKSLDVSNFDLSNVKSLKTAFVNCYKLESLDFSNVNMSNVNSFVSTFENCTSLREVIFGGDSINTVANMQYMFAKCTSLTTVDLSGISIVENTNSMFSNCTSLETIYVDRDWSLFLNESSANMFNACNNLVGGSGTTFNSNYINDTYACIDKGSDKPGYFTLKNVITITFDKNGASGEEVMENQIANNDGETTLSKNLWTNDGYKFSGWNTVADGTGLHYDDEGTYVITESITLYAEWTKIEVEHCDYVLNERFIKWFSDSYIYIEDLIFVEGGDIPEGRAFELGYSLDHTKTLYGYYYEKYEDDIYNLTVYIPEGSTLYAPENSEELFRNKTICRIKNLNLLNTSKVTNMSYLFWNCRQLEEVDLSSFDTSNVTTMLRMFEGCTALKHINFGENFDTSKVKDISYMFISCFNLEELDLSTFDTSNIKDLGSMFTFNYSLKEIKFGEKFVTDKVTNMSGVFYNCTALETLDLTNFDTSACTRTTNMFDNCSSLKTIYISDKWDMQNVTASKDMFIGCNNLVGGKGTKFISSERDVEHAHADYGPGYKGYLTLKDLIVVTFFPNDGSDQIFFITPDKNSSFEVGNNSFTNWGYDFVCWNTSPDGIGKNYSETDMIENITSDMNFYAMWKTQVNYMLNEKFMNNLADQNIRVSYLKFVKGGDIPAGDKIEIGYELDGNEKLYGYRNNDTFTVYIPEGATLYAPEDASNLFSHGVLKDIENLNLLDTSKTTNMSFMFDGSDHLINLDLSGFDVSNVTDMSYMFYCCINLQNINFGSNFNTKNVKTFFTMFSDCEDLAKLDLSGWNTASATDMAFMFVGCTAVKEIKFGENFTTDKVTRMIAMFSQCHSLEYLDLSSFDISKCNSIAYMFKNCFQLKTICVSDKWNTKNVGDTSSMFLSCNRLVGGKGTAFDSNNKNGNYAHIDYGTANKGYLTLKDLVVVTYDKNDGSNSLDYTSTTVGNDITLNNNFSYVGYKFTTWNTKKDGTGTSYSENAEIKNLTNDLTLYAIWKEENSTSTNDKDTTVNTDTSSNDKNTTDTTNTNTNTTTTTTTTKKTSQTSTSGGNGGSGGGGGSNGSTNSTSTTPLNTNTQTTTTNTVNTTAINNGLGSTASKVTNGFWFKADISWKLNVNDGSAASNGWYEVKNADNSTSFYKFDTAGNMETGLVSQNGSKYYLNNNATAAAYGSMQFGWQNVNGTNNYFGADGRLLASGTTPDGFVLDSAGKVVGLASSLKALGITTTTVNGVVENLNFDSATPYKEQVSTTVNTVKQTATTIWNQVKNIFKGFSF